LHTHTHFSDGTNPPERLFAFAKRLGLSCIAITDHDYLPDPRRDEALSGEWGVRALWGTEISAFDCKRGRRVHILCYLPDDPAPVREICEEITRGRMAAGEEMVRLTAEKFPIRLEDVLRIARPSGSIFKQHIMLALMEMGYSPALYGPLWKELFDAKTGSCVRTCRQPDVWEVLPVLRAAGGVCVLAHPFTYDSIDVMGELMEAHLLDGIEVWSSKSNGEQEAFLLERTEKAGLIPTGGSDFHGAAGARVSPMGSGCTPEASIRAILERKGR